MATHTRNPKRKGFVLCDCGCGENVHRNTRRNHKRALAQKLLPLSQLSSQDDGAGPAVNDTHGQSGHVHVPSPSAAKLQQSHLNARGDHATPQSPASIRAAMSPESTSESEYPVDPQPRNDEHTPHDVDESQELGDEQPVDEEAGHDPACRPDMDEMDEVDDFPSGSDDSEESECESRAASDGDYGEEEGPLTDEESDEHEDDEMDSEPVDMSRFFKDGRIPHLRWDRGLHGLDIEGLTDRDVKILKLAHHQHMYNSSREEMENMYRMVVAPTEQTSQYRSALKDVMRRVGVDRSYTVMYVCEGCNTVYSPENVAELRKNPLTSQVRVLKEGEFGLQPKTYRVATCTFIAYPFGPSPSVCGHSLEDAPTGQRPHGRQSREVVLKPNQILQYYPLTQYLANLCSLMTLAQLKDLLGFDCEPAPGEILGDYKDGQSWFDFCAVCQDLQRDAPPGIETFYVGCTLSADWAAPLDGLRFARKSTKAKKFGLFNLTFLNISSAVRWKKTNIHTFGIIEGEPAMNVNGLLRFIVQEFKALGHHNDFRFKTRDRKTVAFVARLLEVAGDSPARSKMVQLSHHSARHACHCCHATGRVFYHLGDHVPLSDVAVASKPKGMKRAVSWDSTESSMSRTTEQVLMASRRFLRAANDKEAEKIASQNYRVRYSELFQLCSLGFDPVRMTCIDAMHAILLGVLKFAVPVFVCFLEDAGKLDDAKIVMRSTTRALRGATKGCRTVREEIFDNVKTLTAAEMFTFLRFYSRVVFELLGPQRYKLWLSLADACEIFLADKLRQEKLVEADAQYKHFLQRIHDHVYIALPYNFHLLLHLLKQFTATGPARDSWCFGLERLMHELSTVTFNGNLEGMLISYARHHSLRVVSSLLTVVEPSASPQAVGEDSDCQPLEMQRLYASLRHTFSQRPAFRAGVINSVTAAGKRFIILPSGGTKISFDQLKISSFFEPLCDHLARTRYVADRSLTTFYPSITILAQQLCKGSAVGGNLLMAQARSPAPRLYTGTLDGFLKLVVRSPVAPDLIATRNPFDQTIATQGPWLTMVVALVRWHTIVSGTETTFATDRVKKSVFYAQTSLPRVIALPDILVRAALVTASKPHECVIVKLPFVPL
eukprot:m.238290 g.238290  ORF g.238290 m.238290 type:complete len:1115 (+) comp21692_c0_seq1:80-3424(+)